MEIRGLQKDLEAFSKLVTKRQEYMKQAPAEPDTVDPINALSRRMHPDRIALVLKDVFDENQTTRTFRFESAPGGELPYFRAGQYLSLKVSIGNVLITRPYSLSSAPADSLSPEGSGRGFYDVTVRRKDGGFLTDHIWKTWRPGTPVVASGPHGNFYFEPLRDEREIIGIAGGSGITPFRSIIREMAAGGLDMTLTLLYGIVDPGDIIFGEELREAADAHADRLKVFFICSEPDDRWSGPAGFITASCIRELAGPVAGRSFFICGPPAMYRFLDGELKDLGIARKSIRREVFGEYDDPAAEPGFPAETAAKTFSLKVHMGSQVAVVPARGDETVLVSLERAGIGPDSQCRSGECGWCRSLLISGNIHVMPENDGRRSADKELGFFHPCSSYPLSDLEIQVPLTGAMAQ